jgi:SAM-dependent methyltransferase
MKIDTRTFRRKLLDESLGLHAHLMRGDVIDVGGKKEKKAGSFRPPVKNISSWRYVNIDETTLPDYLCSAENIPVEDASFDVAIICEVQEHLENPSAVLKEIFRILKDRGMLFYSAPFLYPFHGDPYDFQRWTEIKTINELEYLGYKNIIITPMGGIGAVIHDLIRVAISKISNRYIYLMSFALLFLTKPVFQLIDWATPGLKKWITSGYFVTAQKKS